MLAMQRLLAIEACRETILRAARAADTHDAAGFAAQFTDNAELQRPSGAALQGREAIRQAYDARPRERLSRHLLTNIQVLPDPDDAGRAQAISSVLLWSASGPDTPGPQGRRADGRQLVGEFEDELVLTAEGWRIARRRAQFLMFSGD